MTSFHHLKPGDKVFVVQQMRRGDTEVHTSTETISRVGRKYGYLARPDVVAKIHAVLDEAVK